MFPKDRWAEAFIRRAEDGADEGLSFLVCAASALKRAPPDASGAAAARAARAFDKALLAAGYREQSSGVEAARALLCLLVKRGALGHADSIIQEIQRLADKKAHILGARLDAALPLSAPFLDALKTSLCRASGAADVRLHVVLAPQLLGGCRLTIDDEMLDCSLSGALASFYNGLRR
ncbi:MAG: F0F1 ATP synthase subunit delta [Spirochaetaceae bacterium]|jgi:F0F1-type ATP synthase delta subunit|nr:F0F1 ATP synthase subunit delta [Spirochaetaceae bacterium]